MITSAVDPRDERFLVFLRRAAELEVGAPPLPARIEGLVGARRAVAEAVEVRAPPEAVAGWALDLAGWALSPDPVALEGWALDALHRLRRDPVRARNVARGIVDWVMGQLRSRVEELRGAWQALHDAGLGYPIDPELALAHPAAASADVAVWSYALLQAVVMQHARGLPAVPTTLAAARARGRTPRR